MVFEFVDCAQRERLQIWASLWVAERKVVNMVSADRLSGKWNCLR